jgi:penicillin-binding protein 2
LPADWPVAGKTGTAEVFDRSDTSWFLSYAPAGAPRYAVSVAVSQGGHGSETAAPVARSIHEALRRLR